VSVDGIMAELTDRVRERIRAGLLHHGASPAFEDPALFADVETILRRAVERSQPSAVVLPELLGEPDTWRLDTAMRYQSHRGAAAPLVIFFKRRLLMPIMRWLFEYSRDNFERQRRVNYVLCACVQELAIEAAHLRREVRRLSIQTPAAAAGRSDSAQGR
jgi:hypothetical protein